MISLIKELSVVKNVAQEGSTGEYIITTPKTRTSTRTLPVPERVMNDLHELYLREKKQYGFNQKWFVFGDKEPLGDGILSILKINFVTCLVLKELEFTTLDTLVLQF